MRLEWVVDTGNTYRKHCWNDISDFYIITAWNGITIMLKWIPLQSTTHDLRTLALSTLTVHIRSEYKWQHNEQLVMVKNFNVFVIVIILYYHSPSVRCGRNHLDGFTHRFSDISIPFHVCAFKYGIQLWWDSKGFYTFQYSDADHLSHGVSKCIVFLGAHRFPRFGVNNFRSFVRSDGKDVT